MTRAPRFLKPRKLGLASDSWLRRDVFDFEWTANVCLYFFGPWYAVEAGCGIMFGRSLDVDALSSVVGARLDVVVVAVSTELTIVTMMSEKTEGLMTRLLCAGRRRRL